MRMSMRIAAGLFLPVTVLVASGLNAAPQSPVAGVLTYAQHAKNPDAPLSAGSTLFSGDLVETEPDGNAQIQAGPLQLTVLGDSSLRLFASGTGLVAELERGTMSYASSGVPSLLVYALDLRIRPAAVTGSAGQITIVTRCDVRVFSHKGAVEILGNQEKEKHTVEEGKSESFRSLRAVDYRDTWKPVPADYPEIDPNSEYHRSHGHAACPAGLTKNAVSPISTKAVMIGVGAATAGLLCIEICKGFESPDSPGRKP